MGASLTKIEGKNFCSFLKKLYFCGVYKILIAIMKGFIK